MHGSDDVDTHWYMGGIASAAAYTITHPLDLIRMKMLSELREPSMKVAIRKSLKYSGKKGMFFGMRVGVQRQLIYSATRFGFYDLAYRHGLVHESFLSKVIVSGVTGYLAGFITTPIETINVRMCGDLIRPRYRRRKYRNMLGGLKRLYNNGGLPNMFFWSGISSIRGACMSIGQISVYDQVREMLFRTEKFSDNWRSCFIASLLAGGFTTVIITPVDVIKTIGMNSDPGIFRGPMDVAEAVARLYGVPGFYRGINISFLRLVPFTSLTFIFYENLRLHFGIYDIHE